MSAGREERGGRPPVSVVVPTVGRVDQLRSCLDSLAACVPLPSEVLVVDQSGDPALATLVSRYSAAGARVVPCPGRGVSKGRNLGLREAAHEIVLVTDDDCTVEPDWVGTAWRLMVDDPEKLVTGRVLPVGEASAVLDTVDDPVARDHTGKARGGLLFPNNMVLNRSLVLAEGGFDERFGPEEAAEDNDFCYRWLRAGRRLVYEPTLTVHHNDWRTPEQLEHLYARYARGEGFLYAKHLRAGDVRVLRFLARDFLWAFRGLASALVRRRPRWTDPRRATLRSLPGGFVHGWRVYGAERRRGSLGGS
jgi:GT2 family glycosyltransferase